MLLFFLKLLKLFCKLKFDDYSAEAIHGNLRQSKRDRVIRGFRAGKNRILVATDVAARGLDIPLIQHVINFDLPQVPEDYIHRVGRTGRAGKDGSALTFLTNNDQRTWREIQKLIDPNFNLQKNFNSCLLYTSPSPRDLSTSRMPSSA